MAFENTWRTLPENPGVGLALCNLQCVIQYANPAFASLFELEAGAVKGQPLLRRAVPHALEESLHNLRRACAGEPRGFVFHGRHPHHLKPFAVMMAALPLGRPDQPAGVACLAFTRTGSAAGQGIRSLLQGLGEAAARLAEDGPAPWPHPAFARIIGCETGGRMPAPFVPADCRPPPPRARPEPKRNGLISSHLSPGAKDPSMPIIDFEQAIRRRQLEAYFQPIVDLHSGVISALEARVRWNDGLGQTFTADQVLPAARAAEADCLLDLAVLEQAVAATGRQGAGSALPVAVNIAPATCVNEASAAQLEGFLARAEVKPERLRLEFPCAALQSAPEVVAPLLQRLAGQGYAVAIDHVADADFQLARFDASPLQAIKLDESLVQQAPADAASAERIRAIGLAAQGQGLRVGAEGVMRLEQLEFLRQAGCHEGQGPLISRPNTLDQLSFLLRRGRCW